ncbi:MAG TPA: hypothetical protein PK893_10275 [Candidatus Competibacteraceae bacterium]|nr:hypothetical protein [Candidatus Competibacteraceae bacterium]
MKEAIQAIGSVVTSPYPYFAVFGYFGLSAFTSFSEKEPNGYMLALFGILILFLGFLCVLVFVLIQKVGHSSMLSPEHQVEVEKLKLGQEQAKLKLQELAAREISS